MQDEEAGQFRTLPPHRKFGILPSLGNTALSRMIFHDISQQRKIALRALVVLVAAWLLIVTADFVVALTSGESPRRPVAAEYATQSYQYYYTQANDKKIALTFDDGPHPEHTIAIADVLERENVPGTFFFVGQNILAYPEVVREIYRKGFEIGNHTFTHDWEVHDSKERLARELSSTSFLLERITGTTPKYYRPPYLLAIGIDPALNPNLPRDPGVTWSLEMGYVPVGIDIDSHDWNANDTEDIVRKFEFLSDRPHHIVLFHDRDVTARALPHVISRLKAEGYTFVTLEELLTPPGNALAAPAASAVADSRAGIESGFIFGLAASRTVFTFLVEIALGLMAIRLLVFIVLALVPERRKINAPYTGVVSVIVPAWNEEENIEATVRSIAENVGVAKEIIVVDDGSTDRTAIIARRAAERYPDVDVEVVSVENGGKGRALNIGILHARGDVIVTVDADAILEKGALAHLAAHFNDDTVGAVAGKVYIARLESLLDRMQALEYLVGQNIEKRLLAKVNGINVVPGAIGAWRRDHLMRSGGFSADTLAEDQDMTLSVLASGFRVVYEPRAIAYTEAPPTVRIFLAQRFRWVYGAMQCFWKHRGEAFNVRQRGLGLYAAIPNMGIFHMLLPLQYPLIDAVLIFALLTGSWWIAAPALFFTLFDLAYAYMGLAGEKNKWGILVSVPIARLVYRQLIFYSILKSIVYAFEGGLFGWNKLPKRGEAKRLYETLLAEGEKPA